ncbi:MAG: hypothetical protein K6V73_03145 [Firmicutes bacterium]|nr:hypothetical protein [Bacillota bacterium]
MTAPGGGEGVAERALALLGELPGEVYLRLEAGGLRLRNLPVRLARGEAGTAGGEDALKLVFVGEAMLALSRLRSAERDADGRVVLASADGVRVLFGPRPW